MDRKKIGIIIGVVVVIVAVVGVALLTKRAPSGYAPGTGAPGTPSGPVTRTAVPSNVVVPGQNATSSVPQNVAVPTVVAPGNPAGTTSYRNFNVKIQSNAFSPNTINVYVGDTVNLNITASDKNYDFTLPDYGFKVPIPEGVTKQVQFSPAGIGKFLFYCTLCGGPQSGPTGYLVVAPKQ